MKESKKYTLREVQAAIDIATVAGELMGIAEIEVEDSRELNDFIRESAQRFETDFNRDLASGKCDEYDYISKVAHFARQELRKKFPSETADYNR